MLPFLYRLAKAVRPARALQTPWDGVPEPFRHLSLGELRLPSSLIQWEHDREAVRQTVLQCLGELPARPDASSARTVSIQARDGYRIEKFVFDNGVDSIVPGYLAIPEKPPGPFPLVLVMHGHGGCKEEPFGMVTSHHDVAGRLAGKGYAVAAIDCYFSGERVGQGPNGLLNRSRRNPGEETAFFKLNLWLGRTLWGMMLRDQQMVLDYLGRRPEIDGSRIGAQGMSLGSTGAWWLAAIDERVRAIVAVACFTRYEELIATRALSAHGIYYFVPGILRHFDTEGVMALVAPRPFLALTGDCDAGSPPEGIAKLEAALRHVYRLYGQEACFESVLYRRTGHAYTIDMKSRMVDWFDRRL